jgi:hypothetical protein
VLLRSSSTRRRRRWGWLGGSLKERVLEGHHVARRGRRGLRDRLSVHAEQTVNDLVDRHLLALVGVGG